LTTFEINSAYNTVATYKTYTPLGNVVALSGADRIVGVFQTLGSSLMMIGKFDGPNNQAKLRFQGGINTIINKPNSSSMFVFSFAHAIYHLDLNFMIMEERNILYNTVPAGDGFVINDAFLLGDSTRAIGIGGWHVDNSNSAPKDKLFEFDLTTVGSPGNTDITNIYGNNHAYGTYLLESGGIYYIGLGSYNYGGKVAIARTPVAGSGFTNDLELFTDQTNFSATRCLVAD
jgi:hypothetical protein